MRQLRFVRRPAQIFVLIGLLVASTEQVASAAPAKPARVVILGVAHNGAQFASPMQQPAAIRAFIDRVHPDDICIERSPEEYARGEFYEFTFEQQDIVVPYATEQRIPIHPIDWLPRADELLLAYGLDVLSPPPLRPAQGFQAFETLEADQLTAKLFWAEGEPARHETRDFVDTAKPEAGAEFARRLFLYRTFMQAERIAKVAAQRPGGTILVVIGSLHKDDIEHTLAGDPRIAIVQPSTFGEPAAGDIRRGVRVQDRFMIATFNLLGLQSSVAFDAAWVRQLVGELGPAGGHEGQLFAIRLDFLTHKLTPTDALARYEALERATPATEVFHWTGIRDPVRLDSVFDPFGKLTVKQRTMLEIARLAHRLGQDARAASLEDTIAGQLSPWQATQLRAYWKPFVLDLRDRQP